MAMFDGNRDRASNVLPSINHVDLHRPEATNMAGAGIPMLPLSIPTGTRHSPTSIHSGPPTSHPASSTSAKGIHDRSGYISPPESTSRRSTRDEKDEPLVVKSLPSIHEALGDRSILNTSVSTAGAGQPSSSTPASATAAPISFSDYPAGPSNPFSHATYTFDPAAKPKVPTEPPLRTAETWPRHTPAASVAIAPTDTNSGHQKSYPYPVSPRASFSSPKSKNTPVTTPTVPHQFTSAPPYSSYHSDPARYHGSAPSYTAQPPVNRPAPFTAQENASLKKLDDAGNSMANPGHLPPYGDTVKRHLDSYDTEVAFHEISEASSRTLDFARYWSQRHHEVNRSQAPLEGAPPLQDVDEVIRQWHRVIENLNRVREVSVVHQASLSEERARLARAPLNEQYRSIIDDYKAGGFAGGEAKKRRGKAAPPGRCHSCNRAETPEWRRGPDGARTLCNACGLHYAKLTRKLGANKTGHMTAASLRPKGL